MNDNPRYDRKACQIAGLLRVTTSTADLPCVIENISPQGAKLRIGEEVDLPYRFRLSFSPVAAVREEKDVELRWRLGSAAGVSFSVCSDQNQIG